MVLPISTKEVLWLAKQAVDAMKQWRTQRLQSQQSELVETTVALHRDKVITDFLIDFYHLDRDSATGKIFRFGNDLYHMYALAEWKPPASVEEALVYPLEEDDFQIPQVGWQRDIVNTCVTSLQSMGRTAFDAQTFRLLGVNSTAGGFKLRCGGGRYFTYLGTCESLTEELTQALVRAGITDGPSFEAKKATLEWPAIQRTIHSGLYNRRLFAENESALLDFRLRDMKIGLNVFLVINTQSGPLCFLHQRSGYLAEYPNVNHVLPAGTFQHDGGHDLAHAQLADSFCLTHKVLSELWEECFEGGDANSQKCAQHAGAIALDQCSIPGHPSLFPIRDIATLLTGRGAHLAVTGFGIDLFACKPDLTFLLVIDDVSFFQKYRNHFKPNWEFGALADGGRAVPRSTSPTPGMPKEVRSIHLTDTKQLKALIAPGMMIPTGAMAVVRGFETLAQLRSQRRISFDVSRLD